MSEQNQVETVDVAIVGGGPTGAVLSALLGNLTVQNVVLEKEKDIASDPRAITIDEDAIRVLQEIGLYNKVYTEIGSCIGIFRFISGNHFNLTDPGFMSIDARTAEGLTTHVAYVAHRQPILEKHIRTATHGSPFCELRKDAEVVFIDESPDWVHITYVGCDGTQRRLRCRFVVGADGGRGYVRKQYLAQKGIYMKTPRGTTYEETWVAMNWHISLPTPKTHPKFPLWSLGYTSEQVYDLFFPSGFRFLCNPERPAVCGRFGLLEDRYWRFEFVVQAGEDGNAMSSPEMIEKVVMPYFRHPGSRYGLHGNVEYPRDCIQTLRSRPFKFAARTCNKWALGRVMLIGDAAHVFPPFGGQGLASGFRDASTLAWRLSVALKPGIDYHRLLKAWYSERQQQLIRSLAITVRSGQYVTERNWLKATIRDWQLWATQLFPNGKRAVEGAGRANRGLRWIHEVGMPFDKESGGFVLPQVYCANVRSTAGREPRVHFTDDVIFSSDKECLFQLLVLLESAADLVEAQESIQGVDEAAEKELRSDEATYLIQSTDPQPLCDADNGLRIFRLATGKEFAEDADVAAGRPEPHHYDALRLWEEVEKKRYIIVRPDRFVFGTCNTKPELDRVVRSIPQYVQAQLKQRSQNLAKM